MNYIWDILLRADKENIQRESVSFVPAKVYSPYMEISFIDLNSRALPEDKVIEVNPYYRFQSIFKDLVDINVEESEELRTALFDIIIHYLAEVDLTQGLCKEEFYKKFIMEDINKRAFGRELSEDIYEFTKRETDCILSGLITLYLTGTSLQLFNKVMRNIFKRNRVYVNRDDEMDKEILLYLGEFKTQKTKKRIDTLIDLFLPINIKVVIYWEKHFGIIGIEDTMRIDEMVIN